MLQPDEDQRFLDKFNRFFRKAVNDYGLIARGTTVLVALSGGKDSLALLEQMANPRYRKQKNISVFAAHIRMQNISYDVDLEYLQQLCDGLNVPLIVRETTFDPSSDRRKSPCFLCSWNRRKTLFDIAKEHDCHCIALGHHLDDMLETLLMNMTFQGSFSTMPPLLKMEKFEMNIIRPLSLLTENDMKRYADIRQFRPMHKRCPYEKESFRSDIKNIIDHLSTLNPKARTSLLASMTNIKTDYLPSPIPENHLPIN
ncbi:MAG: ATP-binding protein [Bacteroidales bacterium]|nr:ATP-binding protein [Bacteroidales bacterium]